MKALELKKITKTFGTNKILNNISLDVGSAEFLVLVGPSGCGKSTLLRSISGLEKINEGSIFINGKDATKKEPQEREIAMVFQSYALYPHMTVFANIAFALKVQKLDPIEINNRVNEIAEMLKITNLLNRRPKELSGGQRQRVSLGRALARRASIILFDEPLSNLDAHLRNQMRIEIKKIHQELKPTIVYVTHDQTEAMTMGDRIAVLNKGNIEQIDSPYNIYHSPKNIFVANFIGTPEINMLEGQMEGAYFVNQNFKINLNRKIETRDVVMGIRPENIFLSNTETQLKGEIVFFENLGPNGLLHVNLGGSVIKLFIEDQINQGVKDHVFLTIDETKIHLFDKKTTERI